jgi:hypothetical protein
MTKAELEEEARKKGVDVNSSMTKQEMIDAIEGGGDSGGGGVNDGGGAGFLGGEGLSEGEARQRIRESGATGHAGHQSLVIAEAAAAGELDDDDIAQEAPEEPDDTSQHGGLIQAPKTDE